MLTARKLPRIEARNKRLEIATVDGHTLSILVEFKPGYTFQYAAVLGDWDEGCKYQYGKTAFEAVDELLAQLDAEPACDVKALIGFL